MLWFQQLSTAKRIKFCQYEEILVLQFSSEIKKDVLLMIAQYCGHSH